MRLIMVFQEFVVCLENVFEMSLCHIYGLLSIPYWDGLIAR